MSVASKLYKLTINFIQDFWLLSKYDFCFLLESRLFCNKLPVVTSLHPYLPILGNLP